MTERFDKFTEGARRTLQLAHEEAQRFNHNYIGTEHVLLGLVRESDGVAARVLNSLGIELKKVRVSVEFIIGRGDRMVMGEVGLTPRAKRVIELAVDEARRLNHHYIGTEHLLLALVREGEGIAAGVLESLGVSLKRVRAATVAVQQASQGVAGQPSGGPPVTDRFDAFTERARNTLRLAHEEAWRYGHNDIGSEHIFLGLVREGDGVAARVLQNLGVELGKVREAVESLTATQDVRAADPTPKAGSGTISTSETGLSEGGKRVIELAVEESQHLNHHYVGTEHLLLGVLRETDGLAAKVLEALGLSLDRVRAEVIKVLRSSSGYRSGGSRQTSHGPEVRIPRVSKSISYWFEGEPNEQPDEPEATVRGHIRGSGYLSDTPINLSDEAIALSQWVNSELDFAMLKHVDNSFLGVLRDAMPLALLLGYAYIGTDHLLAAMLRDENSAASQLLTQHQADLEGIYGILEGSTGEVWSNPFTFEAMRSIYLAIEEARSAAVKATAEHLLLGIMLEGSSSAFVALAGSGVTTEEVRALLSGGNAPGSE